ncbi:hypothetical protein BTO20_11545 [Mycobacterium dioxanotrophicus]|uniref:Uncharacterized protein n=1 Tax=Mycobacterium dioxanotrophicus TaxID=482462 RepID=A0A1Y0C1R9_9MYCO|nr:hypothetical protein [Mycobacterium dioxanotrophicus]ART69130.1 hypothetical protein BTO20_11545 [Mycobacterium dioxanotrophicus]
MTAGTWQFTNTTRIKLLNGQFNLATDSFKLALVTSASNIGAASTTWAGVTGEVANGSGYTTGGIAVTANLAGTTSVTAKLAANAVWTAAGSGITARWAVLYEVGGDVVGYVLLDNTPADVVVTAGNTLTLNSTTTPVLTLA